MKAIFSLRQHSYLKTIGTFMIAIALIAGIVGCDGTTPDTYELAMAADPTTGGTAIDQTGTSPYEEGEIVDIEAVPADCYRFTGWTSSAGGTFGDANNATTTFTMPAQDVTVTANFEAVPPPDHYKFYEVDWLTAPYVGMEVLLEDQFGTFNATVGNAVSFGNPVEKLHNDVVTPIGDDTRHYTLYELDYGEEEPMLDSWQVVVNNQFQDDVELTVQGPIALAVPTQKEDHEAPVCLDHLLVYQVMETEFPEFFVNLQDQFGGEDVLVWGPVLFANPVQKTHGDVVTPIEHEAEHYVFYDIEGEIFSWGIQITNQFGLQTLNLVDPELLAVPSQKISWGQPLDHFKSYGALWVDEPPATFPADVQLEDQFITEWLGEPLIATVLDPVLFANPVNKEHGEVWTPVSNWDNHLTLYNIAYEEIMPIWYVTVDNQFGVGQEFYLEGPTYLAVPTKKGPHDPPMGLDHFLVYTIISDPLVLDEDVWLWDQFTSRWSTLYPAGFFANPVKKIYGTEVTDIKHPNAHLTWYYMDGGEFDEEELPIANQFGPQILGVYEGWYMDTYDLLGVPSQKTDFSIAD